MSSIDMLVPLLLVGSLLNELALSPTKSCGKKLARGCNSNTSVHIPAIIMVPVNQVISNGIHFVEIRHCSKDLHSCSVLSKCSVPFLEIGHGPLKLVHAKCHC